MPTRSPAHERTVPAGLHEADPPALARVSVVLVGTSHPGNVGAAARAMKTMGLRDLRLVAPRFADIAARDEAVAFASGAADVLGAVCRFDRLADAIADATLAVAVSAEPREFGPPPQPPEVAARDALAVLTADPAHRVAFVFGAERTGLSIAEVQACGALASIPASPAYASLNLAQALQVVAYCVRRAALEATAARPGGGATPATPDLAGLASAGAVAGCLEHLEETLRAVGFLDPAHPKKLMPRLRRLALRARLRTEEVDLLRGICTAMQRAARR
jgi:tRNA/rRNA methyltransferase